jgi:hypothetical protein
MIQLKHLLIIYFRLISTQTHGGSASLYNVQQLQQIPLHQQRLIAKVHTVTIYPKVSANADTAFTKKLSD